MAAWQERRLGELVSLTSGQSPSGFRFRSAGIPYFKVDQLGRSTKYLDTSSTPYFATQMPTVPAGSVLIAKRGGAIALNRVRLTTMPSFMDTNVMALTPGPELESEFLFYWLSYRGLWDIADVTSVPQINNKHINPLGIALPDIPEQRRIVGALRDVDALIATVERVIVKKQAIKHGMRQDLLSGRVRLPGHTAPWAEARLGSLGKCIRGVAYEPNADLSSSDQSFTVRLLRSNNVQDGQIDRRGLQFVHERRVSSAQVLASGDLVICMANGSRALVGKAALFEPRKGEPRYTFGAFMGAFRTDQSLASPRYIAELMRTHVFRNWLDVLLSGSSINNLRPGDIEGFVASLPSLAEQVAIAETLGDADYEIDQLGERLAKARAIKQGMMQQLLTGRVRLPVEGAA